ncbi:hypothetical protein NDU88_005080 [Pleurodeles waltl]|uniref:Uncharacterized protein n=1 Tax=Pleurodeles waltl TaxID=8319 RepID=A0AAV7QG95_PLEWA|nr:hypothetical protein NDU88_005080 [Pleurodeles waltl]
MEHKTPPLPRLQLKQLFLGRKEEPGGRAVRANAHWRSSAHARACCVFGVHTAETKLGKEALEDAGIRTFTAAGAARATGCGKLVGLAGLDQGFPWLICGGLHKILEQPQSFYLNF